MNRNFDGSVREVCDVFVSRLYIDIFFLSSILLSFVHSLKIKMNGDDKIYTERKRVCNGYNSLYYVMWIFHKNERFVAKMLLRSLLVLLTLLLLMVVRCYWFAIAIVRWLDIISKCDKKPSNQFSERLFDLLTLQFTFHATNRCVYV